jgi:ATP-dependent RNA helicase DeaD
MPFASRSTRRRLSSRPKPNRAQLHDAVCSDCGAPTTVPFQPSEDRPVYCPWCLKARRNGLVHTDDAPGLETLPTNAATHDGPHDAPANAGVFPGMVLKAATRAAIGRMNISDPTPIQEQSIPCLLAGRDLIGQARTGSGKTLAYAAPLVERCDPKARQIQALVLVPTRELAIQVAAVTEALAAPHRLRVTLLYGGRSLRPEYTALKSGVQIIIGTPGRTLDHIRQGTLDLRTVRFLVLDEADEMLDRGFARDVDAILARTPTDRQTALLSATMPEWVTKTARKHLNDPVMAKVDAELQALPSVEHLIYTIQRADKMDALRSLLDRRDGAPVLVFGKTKHGVKRLAGQLGTYGYPVGALQGNLSQAARERVMKDFRSGAAPILVATNVAARGLDVEGIGQVINFDLPDSEQLFTHRVGRTGRMGRAGEAITFITPDEDRKWREIERGLGRQFTRKSWTRERRAEDRRNKAEEEFADAGKLRVRPKPNLAVATRRRTR